MSEFLTDEELDAMFEEDQRGGHAAQQAPIVPAEEYPPEPVPLYSLALAQAPQQSPATPNGLQQPQTQEGLLKKEMAGVPVWAWGLMALGIGGTGYFFYRSRKVQPNPDGDKESAPKLGDIIAKATMTDGGSGGSSWSPSRSSFAERLERYFQRKGVSQHVKVWHDADDAKEQGKLKVVSPLINVEIKKGGSVKVDQGLTRFCRREGLNPVTHPDGSIGLYPHTSKRGKEWEEYIDALRDDGQSV